MPIYPDLRRLFVVSTAHLSKKTAETHTQYDESNALWPVPYGFVTWSWDVDDQSTCSTIPADLLEVLRFLRDNYGATDGDYFRFDCDGPILPNLKTYDW
jgi:hypothetical protein